MTSRKASQVILRVGIAFVFVWFGSNQLLEPSAWAGLIPSWVTATTGLAATKVVMINGIVEIVLAVLLALGLYLRPVSALMFLHLGGIVYILGLTPAGVRDIGLMAGLASIFLGNRGGY